MKNAVTKANIPNVKFGTGERQALANVDPRNGVINPAGQALQLSDPRLAA